MSSRVQGITIRSWTSKRPTVPTVSPQSVSRCSRRVPGHVRSNHCCPLARAWTTSLPIDRRGEGLDGIADARIRVQQLPRTHAWGKHTTREWIGNAAPSPLNAVRFLECELLVRAVRDRDRSRPPQPCGRSRTGLRSRFRHPHRAAKSGARLERFERVGTGPAQRTCGVLIAGYHVKRGHVAIIA